MNNKYIPEIFKEKISIFINFLYGAFLLFISIFMLASIVSFDIADNSFLTSSNSATKNILGPVGSHISSFILYTFGLMGYFFFYEIPSNSVILGGILIIISGVYVAYRERKIS